MTPAAAARTTTTTPQPEVDWGNAGTAAPFRTQDAAHLDIDVTNGIGGHRGIQMDGTRIDVYGSRGARDDAVRHHRTARRPTENFQSFADFEAALGADLKGTTTAVRITAKGA